MALRRVREGYYSTLSRSGLLSSLYYAVQNRAFDREHKAALAARAEYLRGLNATSGNIYVLRRNVHKIEKGLVMKPRRPVFGLTFIEETVRCYRSCLDQLAAGAIDDRESVAWSHQVLGEYFTASGSHPIVDRCRAIYEGADAACVLEVNTAGELRSTVRRPFTRDEATDLPSYEQLLALAIHRRSVRWFKQETVPRDLLDKAFQIAGMSPSACNRQPFRFMVYDDPELCQDVASIPKGTPGWVHNIPCFIVIVGTLEAFDGERDRHVPYIDGSLAAMALCFALETLGLSSCCVNWPDLPDTEPRMARRLGLETYERPIMCLAVGYADGAERVPYSQKLPLESLRIFNHHLGR